MILLQLICMHTIIEVFMAKMYAQHILTFTVLIIVD